MVINNHKLPDKTNVLGTEYKIKYSTEDKDPKMVGNDGYCEIFTHEIHIEKKLFEPSDNPKCFERLDLLGLKTIRHEIIHAFASESGLCENCDWAKNEELIDWIAIQFPKIMKCFIDLGVAE